MNVLCVQETDTLTNMAPAANVVELEFGPGRFFHDTEAKKLYVSSSDFKSPERHHYTVGVLKGHGFHMFKCRGVVVDGLAASTYRTPLEKHILLLPVSGFLLHETQQCVVRHCVAYFNRSGITINSGVGSYTRQPGEGRENIVEDCRAYANYLDGIVANNPACETIRNCRTFLNQTYGARFYGGRGSDEICCMEGVISWGNPSADFWMKGTGLSEEFDGYSTRAIAERCVAFRGFMVRKYRNCLVGGTNSYSNDMSTSLSLPDDQQEFHKFLDANFADPLGYDFRYQATSYLQKGAEGEFKGIHPYEANVYCVKTDGNDRSNGLSMDKAWKTPAAAMRKLKAGDTLYIAPGRYLGNLVVNESDVRIRGRGLYPVVFGGGLRVAKADNVLIHRVEFRGPVCVTDSENVELSNCVFSGSKVEAEDLKGVRMEHNVFGGTLKLEDCSQVVLRANTYASAPAVSTDSLDAIAYSDYNSYTDVSQGWVVDGKVVSVSDLAPACEAYATIATPKIVNSRGATVVANAFEFTGRGPLSTAIGPYREWQPREIGLVGPFVESSSDKSADIEWWSTSPVQVELAWGDTPECVNRKQFKQNAFPSHSLLGLERGKKYYVKVEADSLPSSLDPARRFYLAKTKTAPVRFSVRSGQTHQPVTYYVALNGDDAQDGLSRATAWRSVQTAADRVRLGDTVLIADGTYPGTFYSRRTGEQGKPITFKAIPGERVLVNGMEEKLHAGFVLYGKHHYRVDSLYFNGYSGIEDNSTGKEGAEIVAQECADLQVTRCSFSRGWVRCFEPRNCSDLVVRNCVFMHSMEAVMVYYCPNLLIENCLFISPLITHLHVHTPAGATSIVRRCVFGENTRGKLRACPVMVDGTMENNCFYMRCTQYQRKLYNNKTLPEHIAGGTDAGSMFANPYMLGGFGFRRGWQIIENSYKSDNPYEPIEFNRLFPTNPELVVRNIGLQPEAFSDFHFFANEKWPYDKKWALQVKGGMDAAKKLEKQGDAVNACRVYMDLVENWPMSDRLKTDVLDRAAQCAAQAKDYKSAIEIAKDIPLRPFMVRRTMALLIAQKKYAELVKWAVEGNAPEVAWVCPEDEMVLADAYYYRGLANAHVGDLKAAETDTRTMLDKGAQWGYQPGVTVLATAWKRLGDFYYKFAKDNAKALEAYEQALSIESNPEIADHLADAARIVKAIKRK